MRRFSIAVCPARPLLARGTIMRCSPLVLAVLAVGQVGCASTSGTTGEQDVEAVDPEALPSGADLELAIDEFSTFHIFPDCPAQDNVHLRVGITAPVELDIVSVQLLSFQVGDTLTRVVEDEAGRPQTGWDSITAGERETVAFNVPVEDGPALCTNSYDSLGESPVTLQLDVHGAEFEVVGVLEMWCAYPAPHTCD
jgi:hypothetical protein